MIQPPPSPGGWTPARPRNGLGTAALVVAVVGLVLCWSVLGGALAGVVAVALGIGGRTRAGHGGATNGPVATGGIALGVMAIVVSLALIPVWAKIFRAVDMPAYVDCVARSTDQRGATTCADQLRHRTKEGLGVDIAPVG